MECPGWPKRKWDFRIAVPVLEIAIRRQDQQLFRIKRATTPWNVLIGKLIMKNEQSLHVFPFTWCINTTWPQQELCKVILHHDINSWPCDARWEHEVPKSFAVTDSCWMAWLLDLTLSNSLKWLYKNANNNLLNIFESYNSWTQSAFEHDKLGNTAFFFGVKVFSKHTYWLKIWDTIWFALL